MVYHNDLPWTHIAYRMAGTNVEFGLDCTLTKRFHISFCLRLYWIRLWYIWTALHQHLSIHWYRLAGVSWVLLFRNHYSLHWMNELRLYWIVHCFWCRSTQEVVADAVIPTLRILFNAPASSPLAEVNVNNVVELLVQLTNHRHIVQNNDTEIVVMGKIILAKIHTLHYCVANISKFVSWYFLVPSYISF